MSKTNSLSDDIYKFVKKKVETLEAEGKRPLSILVNEVLQEFGEDAKKEINNLIKEKKLFFGHTINSIWISTKKKII